eukprot:2450439-Prymnesium_polylepis.1
MMLPRAPVSLAKICLVGWLLWADRHRRRRPQHLRMLSNGSAAAAIQNTTCHREGDSKFRQNFPMALTVIIWAHTATLAVYILLVWTVPRRMNVPWNERVFAWLQTSNVGNIISLTHAMLSLVSCVLFVIETYLVEVDSHGCEEPMPLWYLLTELCMQPMFVWHYLLLLVLHQKKWSYILSVPALIDKVTVIPVYIDLIWLMVYLYDNENPSGSSVAAFGFFRIVRAIKVARLLRFFKSMNRVAATGSVSASHNQEAQMLIVKIISTVLLMVIMSTGLVQFVSSFPDLGAFYISSENSERKLKFHEALYFTIVTLSTVGYGDVIPAMDLSRALSAVIILIFLFALPFQTARLIEFNAMLSKYRGTYTNALRHIV